MDYGIVQLSDERFTVSSFTIVFSGCNDGPEIYDGSKFFEVIGNSFKTKEITDFLKVPTSCLLVNIDYVRFLNFAKQEINAKKGVSIKLIN